jgi:hypothetical protein
VKAGHRYQNGCMYEHHGAWYVRYRQQILQEDGSAKLNHASKHLGRSADMNSLPVPHEAGALRHNKSAVFPIDCLLVWVGVHRLRGGFPNRRRSVCWGDSIRDLLASGLWNYRAIRNPTGFLHSPGFSRNSNFRILLYQFLFTTNVFLISRNI